MIPAITEVNFPQYATLHQATVSLQEMGERNISTQVRIDGSVVPSFDNWELRFKGERFILNTKEPQAAKDNTTRNSLVDLTFTSWVINELKRYYFFEPSSIDAGTVVADKYKTSVGLSIEDFVVLFNKVLDYYFGGTVVMSLYLSGQGRYSTDRAYVDIDYTYIWDVLTKFYEVYGERWVIDYNSTTQVYTIKVAYPATAITDHDFEYGYQGGLLKFERQVQDVDIRNILLGRGGEKNLPYRYFKLQDPQNPEWAADPDAIPELANISFDRLRDINFRWYVRGWMQNSHRDTSWDATHTFPSYTDNDCPAAYLFAFQKGKTDEKFNPVEYVKDDNSIAAYGERWGAVEDNDDVFPTIQGVSRSPYGRIDETVAVSEIVTDDIDAMSKTAAIEKSINPIVLSLKGETGTSFVRESETFTIPAGSTGNVTYVVTSKDTEHPGDVFVDTANSTVVAVDQTNGTEVPIAGIPAGEYRLKFTMVIYRGQSASSANGTFGIENIVLTTSEMDADAWKPTFDIWVKNIWNTSKNAGESDVQYANRVWGPILGDRAGNEAKVVFSTGFMSISEDYEFVIVSYPVRDTGKSINGVNSEWRITLRKSDAEYDATGLYIPNATTGGKPVAGDKFFFTGIDMPQTYVELSEEDLNTAKSAELDNTAAVNPTWVINLDKVRCNTLEAGEYGQTLAERLAAGATVKVKDPRFTPGQVLTLYVQSITYTWNEPTDDAPYLVPDIEVVLSDKVVSVESTLGKLQNDITIVKEQYARISDVEAAVRKVAEPLFLKKTGESDSSASPTQFSSKVTSKGFRQGSIGGRGWGLYRDNTADMTDGDDAAEGDSVIEVDRVVVRKELEVNTLVVNQIEARGGKEVLSVAKIEVSKVIEDANSYVCYFNQRQNSVANLFAVNDIAMGQVFDADNTQLRYYKMLVTAVGLDSITLAKANKVGSGVPQVGDVIVQYGNTTNSARQYVIIRDVIGGGYERMLSGLNSLNSDGEEYFFAGLQSTTGPRVFVGDENGEYAEYVNGQLSVRGTLLVKNGNSYTDPGYLLSALPQNGTLVQGGLILSKTIGLTDANNNITAGINGLTTLSNIAAWYGGEMLEKSAWDAMSPADQATHVYAKSIFRFDGSGYLAGDKIKWAADGAGSIPGVSWNAAGSQIVLDGAVKLESSSGDSITDLVGYVQTLMGWFGEDENHNIYVKKLNGAARNFYSFGAVSAGGLSTGGGQSAGNASLSVLSSSASTMESATISASGVGSVNIYSKEKIDAMVSAASGSVTGIAVNGTTYEPDANKIVTLPDYPNIVPLADAIGDLQSGMAGLARQEDIYAIEDQLGGIWGEVNYGQEQIETLQDYFTDGVANNAAKLDGHSSSYFATASSIETLQDYFDASGNAKKALQLATARNLWGQSFDGTADVSGDMTSVGNITPQSSKNLGSSSAYWANTYSSKLYLTADLYFEVVDGNVHLHTPSNKGFWADGFMSAGGLSPAGGQSVGNASLSALASAASTMSSATVSANGVGSINIYSKEYIDTALQTAGTIQTLSLAAGASNGTIHLVINGTAQSDVSVTGLGAAAYRGVASSIGSSVTGLVDGALLYGILGDSFDSTNTVKDFVNSSIATATATYKGSFNLVSDLSLTTSATQAQIAAALGTAISTADNNDYCYVQIPTSDSTPTQIARVDRYKHNGTAWSYEYTLNNSGYTAAQWAAINSGITSALVTDFGNRFTTLEGYFTDGSAKSALKLTTTSKTIWGVTYWTSGGVPDNVTGRPNLYIGTTQVQTSSATQDLTGIGSITASGLIKTTNYVQATRFYLTDSIYFVADSNGVKLEGAGFYTDSFVSAGGLSTGGGTTGIDLAAMWSSLTNATSDAYANTKIATAHIPDLSATYQTVIADLSTIRSRSDEGHTAYGWGNHADAGYITGNQTITLSGDVSGSGTTSISVTIGAGKVTNDMLAGSIANAKLANSAITINGSSTSLGGSFSTASITAGTAGTSSATSGYTFSVPYVTVNQYGIVTGYGTHTHTVNNIPNSSLANSSITIGTTSISLGGTSTTLAGLTSVTSQKFYLDADNYFEVVDGKVHLHVGTNGGFYTDGFVSAGGLSTGSGDSGITESAMWTLLDNTDSTHKINAAHLRIGTGLAVDGNGNIYATNTTQGTITSVTKGTATAGGAVTTNNGAVTIQFPTDYSLPTASASTLGGVKVGNYLSISSGVLSVNEEKVTPITDEIGAIKTAIGGVARAEDILSLEGQIGGIWGGLGYIYDNYLTTAAAADLYQTKYAFTITGQTGGAYALDTIAANAANGASAYSNLGNYVAKSGDTMTGSLTVNGGISTTTLSASSDVSISNGCSLWCKNSNNSIRIFADGGGDNYIESGNNAFTANADLHLTGYNGTQGGDLFLYFSWTEIYGSASIGGNITAWQNIICHGQVSAGVASDSRLKDNIETMTTEQALAIVSALRPVTFEWNDVATSHLDTLTGADFGLVAQEVESVIPQAVSPIWEKYKRVDYTRAVTPLVKVAQDHESRIASLERENRKLRAEVEHLRGRVCSGNS